jgi:hypothetical protein
MTSRKPTFRPGLRDQQRAIKATMQGMARLHGVTLPDGALSDVKDKIARGPRVNKDTKPESEVQSEIIDFLLRHPRVALVERINSGAVYNANGSYVQFHHVYRPKRFTSPGSAIVKMRAADLSVMLDDGMRCAIECKREGWTKPCNEREHEQDAYIRHISANGGIGFFAASVDDVRKNLILNGY